MITCYDQAALDRLYGEAFAGVVKAEISLGELLKQERFYSRSFTTSADGMAWESVELYRCPEGDGALLIWGFGDGGNMFAGHSRGPCIISRETCERLLAGLDALRPVDGAKARTGGA